MSKKNKKIDKDMRNKIEISIILVIIFIFIVIISVSYRHSTYTQTWLVCVKDVTENYHEVLKFRYDSLNNLYGYYREVTITGDSDMLKENYNYFNEDKSKYESYLDDNFTYEVTLNDDNLVIKNYIGVSVYAELFTKYFDKEGIKADSKLDDIKQKLEDNSYKCNVSRK